MAIGENLPKGCGGENKQRPLGNLSKDENRKERVGRLPALFFFWGRWKGHAGVWARKGRFVGV